MYLTIKIHMIISIDPSQCRQGLRQSIETSPILYGRQHIFFHDANCISYFSIFLDTFTILSTSISQKDPTFFPLLEDIR